MPDPVNVEPALSPAADAVEPETVAVEQNHEEPKIDSVEQSPTPTMPEIVPGVPRETVPDTDPVGDAVAMAVSQWVGFDPAVHAVNPDGSPRLRVDGTYARKRGRGGVSRETTQTQTNAGLFDNPAQETDVPRGTTFATPPSPEAAQVNLSTREAAAAIVITSTTILSRVVGAEWAAEKPELKSLTDATKTYIDAKGGIQMSPEMGLFLAVGMYAAPRFAHENTRSKFVQALDWCKDRFAVLRARFKRAM